MFRCRRRWLTGSGVVRRAASVLALAGIWLALAVASASALTTHVFSASFGSAGAGAGNVQGPKDTAVDRVSHDVYVADTGNFRVDKFDSAGHFILTFGREVDQTTGANICTAASGDTCKAGLQGSGGGAQFSAPTFVAVDNSGGPSSGDVYVGDTGTAVVSKFSASGAFLSSNNGSAATNGPFGSVAGLALDSAGNLWVYSESSEMFEFSQSGGFLQDWESGLGVSAAGIAVDPQDNLYVVRGTPFVQKLSSTGTNVGQVTPENDESATGLTVDPTTRDLYVDEKGGVIEDFASSCEPSGATCTSVDSFGTEQLSGAAGLSVDPSNTVVYVADTANQRVDVFTPVVIPVRIISESALSPTSATVRLEAAINPLGAETTYDFEYGPTASYGASVPAPDAAIGAGNANQPAVVNLTGLQPGTTYHYRVVASNSIGTLGGPDRTFTTEAASCANGVFRAGPSANLPDCRAYEMLTPPNKADSEDLFYSETGGGNPGHNDTFTFDVGQSAEEGNERFLLGSSTTAFGQAPAAGNNAYVFSRTSGGWTTTSLAPPGGGVVSIKPDIFNRDLTLLGVDLFVGSLPNRPAEEPHVLGAPGGPYTTLANTPSQGGDSFAGASSDFSHVVLWSRDHSLVAAANGQVAGSPALYEWFGGHPRLVNVTTGGALISPCGADLGGDGVHYPGRSRHAVSEDGSKIFFISPDPSEEVSDPSCWSRSEPLRNPPHLYMRVNGTTTVDVSAPSPGVEDPNGFQPVEYVGAAANGSKVFFVTKTELTAGDTTHDPELYMYDTSPGATTPLTRISGGVSGTADGNVRFVGAVSSDGSAVYFTAYGQLAPGARPLPSEGQLVNAYRYDTGTGATTFIATVSTDDYDATRAAKYPFSWEVGLEIQANWYTTPNGRFLVFGSGANLTGYNSGGKTEIYRYDSADGTLVCVSCLPSGAPPSADAVFARSPDRSYNPQGRPPRAISDDGSYVFFDTPDALVPQDTNHKVDVYEWHNGAISLISSGKDPYDSFFLDASADGHDVFFGTHSQLVGQDTDFAGDLYDARIGGGFPAPQPLPQCASGGCQGALQAPPTLPSAASELFSGAGNLTPVTVARPVTHTKKLKRKRKRKTTRHRRRTSGRRAGATTRREVRVNA
jgi:hypothetical protein